MKGTFPYHYENIYIGSFIFGFGYIAGRKGYEVPATFSLYQQTPKDKFIGDLFASLGGRNFIIEFKRDVKKIESEFMKEARRNLLTKLNKDSELKLIADKLHFLGFPVEDKLYLSKYSNLLLSHDRKAILMDKFVDDILTQSSLGVRSEELLQYMKVLNECYAESDIEESSSGGRKKSAEINVEFANSGIVFNYDENSRISFCSYHNDLELIQILELSLSLKRERKLEVEQILGRKRDRSRGYSIGM